MCIYLCLGNFHQLKKDRLRVMSSWIKEYGKYFGYYYGKQPIIVCSDLDTIRHVLIKESTCFIDRPQGSISVEPYASSLVLLRGEEWKRVRNAITPSFSAAKMRLMTPIMLSSVDVFLGILKEKARTGESFDIGYCVQGLTLEVICKCALAMDVDCQLSETKLRSQIREFFENIEKDFVSLSWSFPLLNFIFRGLYYMFGVAGVMKQVTDNLEQVIARRRSGGTAYKPDLLQLMLDAQGSSDGHGVTDQHVVSNAFIALIAGYETTAVSLAFISHVLATRPEVQERIIEEARHLFPEKMANNEKLSYEDLHSLKYLSCVVKETLRLYPPVVLFLSRYCNRSCVINGYVFPAGCFVMIPVYQIHHDPTIWEDPEEFRPERFSGADERAISPVQYMPFGAGPRMCIGMRFAMLEIRMAVIEMLRLVRIRPGANFKATPDLVVPTVIINPKDGVNIRVEFARN